MTSRPYIIIIIIIRLMVAAVKKIVLWWKNYLFADGATLNWWLSSRDFVVKRSAYHSWKATLDDVSGR